MAGRNGWTKKEAAARVRKIKRKYGAEAFKNWGHKGGNPVLIEQGKKKREKQKGEH